MSRQMQVLGAVLALMLIFTPSWAGEPVDKGAQDILLEGGRRGDVPFPHHRHQQALNDCQICHELFPRQSGAIQQFIAQGKLESKDVMNKLCTSCHRQRRRAGEKGGPTTCSTCHIRKDN